MQLTEQAKKKISSTLKKHHQNNPMSKQTKDKISNTLILRYLRNPSLRKYVSMQTKKKMSDPLIIEKIRRARKLQSAPMLGKHHTEITKAKIRKARAKQKFPFNNTKIEIALQQALTKAHIKYSTQKYELLGTPDIFIEPNICIFADGDYWHNIPDAQEKDAHVNQVLKEQDYVVLRFWEHEINSDINSCIVKITNAVAN